MFLSSVHFYLYVNIIFYVSVNGCYENMYGHNVYVYVFEI